MNRLGTTSGPELSGVLLTGLGKFLLADWLGLRLVFIVAACLGWTAYVAGRTRGNPAVLGAWGFTTRNLGRSAVRLAPFALLASIVTFGYGMLTGRMLLHWHLALVLLLYPLWGLVQQFIVVALIAGNLEGHSRIPRSGVVLLTALLFAAVHVPSLPLVGISFVMAAITTTVYLQARNLWALGVFHGWVATFVYFFVLGRDPWRDIVSSWIGS